MPFPYLLRPATLEDKEFMMNLEKIIFAQFPNVMEIFDEHHQREHYENYFKPKYVCIIEYGSRPIGAASILVRHRDISILYLYVLPEFQNLGINQALIKRVLTKAKRKLKPVLTCIFKGDILSMELCKGLGFVVIAEDNLRWRVRWTP